MDAWPELNYSAWKDTLETLHMNLQIVGKVRLALTPFEPQWANVPLYLSARGLTTTPMEYAGLIFQIDVDLVVHEVIIQTVRGETQRVALTARSVADFYADFMSNLHALGIDPEFRPIPSEVDDPVPFAEDTVHATYDWNRPTVSGACCRRSTSCSKSIVPDFEVGRRRCTFSGAASTSRSRDSQAAARNRRRAPESSGACLPTPSRYAPGSGRGTSGIHAPPSSRTPTRSRTESSSR